MTESNVLILRNALGDPKRNFKTNPLTQDEIHAIVFTYEKECQRTDIDPELADTYRVAIDVLREHIVH